MITVIIPTYNRVNCIKNLFDKCISKYSGFLFCFEIHDSSESDEVKNICHYHKDIRNVKYYRYSSQILVDKKVIEAIKNINTNYFWLLGDGNLVDFNEFEYVLLKNNFSEYNVINIDEIKRKDYLNKDKYFIENIIYNYKNPVEYARKYFSRLTYWGASIVKTDYCKNILLDNFEIYKNPWWLPYIIFKLIDDNYKKKEVFRIGVVYTRYLYYNLEKKDHWWTNDEKYYIYVFLKFNNIIELLPQTYDKEKDNIIISFRKDRLVSNSYLLHLRSKGVINKFFIKKYKNEIIRVDGFYYKMIFFSYIPRKIALFLNNIKSILKKTIKILKFNL